MDVIVTGDVFLFDGFRLDRNGGGLFCVDGHAVPLGSRALDILQLRVERNGQLVPKHQIMDAVWPGLAVEEGNLTVQVSALRRALDSGRTGASCIQTVPGRGYRFVSAVTRVTHNDDPSLHPPVSAGGPASPCVPLPSGAAAQSRGSSRRRSRLAALVVVGVLILAALLIGGILPASWIAGSASPPRLSVVVLPFKNLSGDPAQAYFSEGLTEEVRAALSRNDALQVLAATSSNAASAHGEDAVSIASRLGVAYLLEGSIQRSNDIVRISADLTDGKTGFSRWSNTVDRKMTDIFALQNAIARMVAEALSVQMATAAPAPGGTTNVPAYEAFLRGRALFNAARDEATDRAALAQYDVAITLDGNFAMAHAARSRSLAAIAAEYAKAEELHPLYDAAIAAAQRAIALAPDLAEGHLALGYALFTGRLDVEGARPSYDRAYALGHGNADILVLFALYCSRAKRGDDARAAILRAIALDPLNPRTYRAAGSIDYAARRYAAAIAPLDRALALNPEISNAHALIGNCLLLLGRLDEARAAYAAEPHALFQLSGLAIVEQRRGDKVAAKKYMDRLIAELGDSALYQQAEVLAQWGQADAALATLERARAIGDSGLIYLSTDPMLDPLRRQPRFARLLNAMRLG